MKDVEKNGKKLVALLTNHDDDVYCFRKELLEGLRDAGYSLLVSCPYGEKFELLTDLEFIHDDVLIDRRGTNVVTDFKLFCHYYKMLKKYRPDIVLGYTTKPNVYASIAARMLKIPVINNVTGLGIASNQGTFLKSFILMLYKLAFRKSACIFFQNEANMKIELESGIVKGDYQLIPGSGVNTERFALQPYPDDDGSIVFNYIGRVLHDKGVDDYIEAARRIKKTHPNTQFNIIGFIEPTESHYEADLKRLEAEDIVIYRGSQKDVVPFIARSHATIHPSTYGEGMSNVLLESASSGRPLITTDNPGCKETLNDGDTGFMYHGGNVDELVEKIELFLAMPNDERRKMGERGREKVKKEFSRTIVVKAYLDKIKGIIG